MTAMTSRSEATLLDRLMHELERNALVLGVTSDCAHGALFVVRRLAVNMSQDNENASLYHIEMVAPVIATAVNVEQLVQQLETLPNNFRPISENP